MLPIPWNPGLENRAARVADVLDAMPRDPQASVAWYVKLLENPRSPLALPGAVDLFGHDCIHIALGRGTLPQDEAFVIGFTMGASQRCRSWHTAVFRWFARYVYRAPYAMTRDELEVYDLAVACGRRAGCRPLHDVDYRPYLTRTVGELRAALGIELGVLYEAFAHERARWPDTLASQRLPRASRARKIDRSQDDLSISS